MQSTILFVIFYTTNPFFIDRIVYLYGISEKNFYISNICLKNKKTALKLAVFTWRPQRDSNSRYRRERAMS